MARSTFFILFIFLNLISNAQKQPIDHSTYKTWPSVIPQTISSDGKFVLYKTGCEKNGYTFTVQATNNSWKRELNNTTKKAVFTANSRLLVFLQSTDSIGLLNLGTEQIDYIPKVTDFKLGNDENSSWLAFTIKSPTHDLMLRNLDSGTELQFAEVQTYIFSNSGKGIIIQSVNNAQTKELIWVNLFNLKSTIIASGCTASNFVFDETCTQSAFIIKKIFKKKEITCLGYYKIGNDSITILADSATPGMKGFSISDGEMISPNKILTPVPGIPLPIFSKDGSKLFFSVKKNQPNPQSKLSDSMAQVDIWNYKDRYLQSVQSTITSPFNRNFIAVTNITSKNKVLLLEQEEDVSPLKISESPDAAFALVESNGNIFYDRWNMLDRPDLYLISTNDAIRTLISPHSLNQFSSFSPSGKYILWYDQVKKNWYTYNIIKKIKKNISQAIPTPLYNENYDKADFPNAVGVAGWLKNDEAVYIYDNYDIWKVDPENRTQPQNVTKEVGRKLKITFRYLDNNRNSYPIFKSKDTLLLTAFNHVTKQGGFFSLSLLQSTALQQLIMGSFAYSFTSNYQFIQISGTSELLAPIKAKSAVAYILQRSSPTSFPNLLFTTNFISFAKLTNFEPQKEYNWYTNELIHWKMPDEHTGEGILYKPENFNSQKKYPIIYYYYEKNSDALNYYLNPELSHAIINIPWFVSNGYLVFVPDIYYKIGHPGESAYNAVVSVAQYFARKNWVDSRRMGLQGHSFGGFETNYIISQTSLFAAAEEGAGLSDIISNYASSDKGTSNYYFFERRQIRLGATLWETPNKYIKNSSLFRADKVTTPLLIMHNKNDNIVPWSSQGAAWFIALQRMGKKVWMLQYDKEAHTLKSPQNQLDFSIRLSQFFDHFLKNTPAPKWMTNGIPAQLKGIESGLELNP